MLSPANKAPGGSGHAANSSTSVLSRPTIQETVVSTNDTEYKETNATDAQFPLGSDTVSFPPKPLSLDSGLSARNLRKQRTHESVVSWEENAPAAVGRGRPACSISTP